MQLLGVPDEETSALSLRKRDSIPRTLQQLRSDVQGTADRARTQLESTRAPLRNIAAGRPGPAVPMRDRATSFVEEPKPWRPTVSASANARPGGGRAVRRPGADQIASLLVDHLRSIAGHGDLVHTVVVIPDRVVCILEVAHHRDRRVEASRVVPPARGTAQVRRRSGNTRDACGVPRQHGQPQSPTDEGSVAVGGTNEQQRKADQIPVGPGNARCGESNQPNEHRPEDAERGPQAPTIAE